MTAQELGILGLLWPLFRAEAVSTISGRAPGRQQYSSFTWEDLLAVAPWMDERITKKIDGAGLGH